MDLCRVYVLSGDVHFVEVMATSADAAQALVVDELDDDYDAFIDRAEFWETDTRVEAELASPAAAGANSCAVRRSAPLTGEEGDA